MFFEKIKWLKNQERLPIPLIETVEQFYESYEIAIRENRGDIQAAQNRLLAFLEIVLQQRVTPFHFDIFHKKVTEPFNFYQFGIDFISPVVKKETSEVLGLDALDEISRKLSQGENVILFANHQTELDPQAMSLLLQEQYPVLAEEMIFVAGHRVTTDPLAVPFSMGRNLLCIFSKHYIDFPPEHKQEKILHNQKTMKKMGELLSEGGKCIYVAPSGGRDRLDEKGIIQVAPFDPQGIEMFYLIAERALKPTSFYPMALFTYYLMPPPETIRVSLGEKRQATCTPLKIAFGEKIDMRLQKGALDKKEQRKARADAIWEKVKELYKQFGP